MRDFLKGKKQVVDVDEDFIEPTPKKNRRSSRGKKESPVVPPAEINFDDVLSTKESDSAKKKRKKGKQAQIDDTYESEPEFMDPLDASVGKGKRNQEPEFIDPPDASIGKGKRLKQPSTQVPLAPPAGKPPLHITPEEINSMLDAKLEKMFNLIAANQSNMEKSFTKALAQQKVEFGIAQRSASGTAENFASQSPVTNLGMYALLT